MGFLTFCRRMMDRGGFATVGLFGVLLLKNGKFPSYVDQIAYGIAAVGTCGLLRFIIMDADRIVCYNCMCDLENIKTAIEHKNARFQHIKTEFVDALSMKDLEDGWLDDNLMLQARVDDIAHRLKYYADEGENEKRDNKVEKQNLANPDNSSNNTRGRDVHQMAKEANQRYTSFQNVQEREQIQMILRQNLESLRNEMERGRANSPNLVDDDTSAERSEMRYRHVDEDYVQALQLLNQNGALKKLTSELDPELFKEEQKEKMENQPGEKVQREYGKLTEKSFEENKEKELEGKMEKNLSKKSVEKEKDRECRSEENMGDQAENIPEEKTKKQERNLEKNIEENELQGKDKNMQDGNLETDQAGKAENIEKKKEEYGDILDEKMGKKQGGTVENKLEGEIQGEQEGNAERKLDENLKREQNFDENLQKEQTKNVNEEYGKLEE